MTKLMAMVAASLMLCGGCSDGDIPPSRWEYQVSIPAEMATTETLAEAEARLRTNGYVRVLFRTVINEWNGRPLNVRIFATRTPGKEAGDGDGH